MSAKLVHNFLIKKGKMFTNKNLCLLPQLQTIIF